MAIMKYGDGWLLVTTGKLGDGTNYVTIEKQNSSGLPFNKMELYFNNDEEYKNFCGQFKDR